MPPKAAKPGQRSITAFFGTSAAKRKEPSASQREEAHGEATHTKTPPAKRQQRGQQAHGGSSEQQPPSPPVEQRLLQPPSPAPAPSLDAAAAAFPANRDQRRRARAQAKLVGAADSRSLAMPAGPGGMGGGGGGGGARPKYTPLEEQVIRAGLGVGRVGLSLRLGGDQSCFVAERHEGGVMLTCPAAAGAVVNVWRAPVAACGGHCRPARCVCVRDRMIPRPSPPCPALHGPAPPRPAAGGGPAARPPRGAAGGGGRLQDEVRPLPYAWVRLEVIVQAFRGIGKGHVTSGGWVSQRRGRPPVVAPPPATR
jgi:hypothetical protein